MGYGMDEDWEEDAAFDTELGEYIEWVRKQLEGEQ
jgi:hypothetical protein